ncbi:Aldo/keto reductase [Punctularia strigosozonata HHB-11173 SS5]|uniref:Aldo/keto reductase n=1 Tax=Punctularia strigosozonata (strain HHB-11173) TaxID=741275 RepID=UPI0004418286|nr:Aldo/keto reductase [Punctularia strigosozonata HHB-11173 SS5]EIN08286.1 Aldo/keto reductase [Punctularia strigosozonata HHB-11173 SS5]
MSTSALNVVLGCGTFGEPGTDGAHVDEVLAVFQARGHTELDTSRIYSAGTGEEYLGKLDVANRGFEIGTKIFPTLSNAQTNAASASGLISHSPEDLRKCLEESLRALKTDSVDIWYLHAPDRSVPYETTLKAVDDLHKEGLFRRLGLSNYPSWEVAEIVGICKTNGYIQPTVYQGVYNAIHCAVEPELFPCLRKFGISFYAFNPLGGGFFTGKYTSATEQVAAGSRFDPESQQGRAYRNRYWNEYYFHVVDKVKTSAEKYDMTMAEIAFRWISHHSLMKRQHGDSVITAASSAAQIAQNLSNLEKGPLPDEILKTLDQAWLEVKARASGYYR